MIPEILNSYSLALDHGRHLVSDLDEAQMLQQSPKCPNHPAWTLGHLVYSGQMIAGEMGVASWLPARWADLFGTGAVPFTSAASHPGKQELLDALADAQSRLSRRLSEMTDADLARPLPDERYRHLFPSLGHAVLHVLTVHTAIHLGQIAAWRRAMGLPAVPGGQAA